MLAQSARRVLRPMALSAVAVLFALGGSAQAHEVRPHPRPHHTGFRLPLPGGGWVRVVLPIRSFPTPSQAPASTVPAVPTGLPTVPTTLPSPVVSLPPLPSGNPVASASALPVPVLSPLLAHPRPSPAHGASPTPVRWSRVVSRYHLPASVTPPASRPENPDNADAIAPQAAPASAGPQAIRQSDTAARTFLPLGIGLALIGAGAALIGLRLRRP